MTARNYASIDSRKWVLIEKLVESIFVYLWISFRSMVLTDHISASSTPSSDLACLAYGRNLKIPIRPYGRLPSKLYRLWLRSIATEYAMEISIFLLSCSERLFIDFCLSPWWSRGAMSSHAWHDIVRDGLLGDKGAKRKGAGAQSTVLGKIKSLVNSLAQRTQRKERKQWKKGVIFKMVAE
jgi:hypothetical protein